MKKRPPYTCRKCSRTFNYRNTFIIHACWGKEYRAWQERQSRRVDVIFYVALITVTAILAWVVSAAPNWRR